MNNYVVELIEDESGELFLPLPDVLVDTLNWEEGDVLEWNIRGDGIVLQKLSDDFDLPA